MMSAASLCSRCAALAALLSLRCSRCAALAALLLLRCSRCAALAALLSLRCSRGDALAALISLHCSRCAASAALLSREQCSGSSNASSAVIADGENRGSRAAQREQRNESSATRAARRANRVEVAHVCWLVLVWTRELKYRGELIAKQFRGMKHLWKFENTFSLSILCFICSLFCLVALSGNFLAAHYWCRTSSIGGTFLTPRY